LTGLYAAVVVLWTISHVWHVQAFSRRVSSRAIHHRHHGILIGSVSGDGVSGSSSVSAPRGRHGHVLHAVPSNKSVPSVPPTNTTTATTATTTNVCLQNQNPLAPRLEELRARHQRGETLTQEYCDTLLASCVAQDEWDMVLDVLEIMNKSGLVQVRSTYRACLQACYSNAASAEQILNAMEQAGIPPEPADIAVTVAAMCRQEKKERGVWWPRALQLLLTANDNSINNNNNTTDLPLRIYDAVLACLTDDRQWKESIRLLRRMEQQQPGALTTTTTIPLTSTTQPALTTYRLVIECCVASRQAEQAVQVLQSCVKRGLVPTVYSFELVVSALSKKLQWRRAVQLLDLMDDLKIKKTLMIYNTILSALAKAGEVVQANNLLVQMRKSDIQPTIKSYNSVMSACASTSRWKDALSVLDQCHRAPGVSPDIYTYTIAMRACAKGES
jgi:pentatricopeptide repeat protein